MDMRMTETPLRERDVPWLFNGATHWRAEPYLVCYCGGSDVEGCATHIHCCQCGRVWVIENHDAAPVRLSADDDRIEREMDHALLQLQTALTSGARKKAYTRLLDLKKQLSAKRIAELELKAQRRAYGICG